MKHELWAAAFTAGLVFCLIALFKMLSDEYKQRHAALLKARKENRAANIRRELVAAEDAYNNADADLVESAALAWSATTSKVNAEIRAVKDPEDRQIQYNAFKWLTNTDKPKHNIRLFYNK